MNDPWVLTCVLGLIGGMVVYTLGAYSERPPQLPNRRRLVPGERGA